MFEHDKEDWRSQAKLKALRQYELYRQALDQGGQETGVYNCKEGKRHVPGFMILRIGA